MTPFRRGGAPRRHLRMVEFGDVTDAEVTADPNAQPPPPPPPRQVTADPADVVRDSPALDTSSGPSKRGDWADLVWQGLFVGVGYGLASEIIKFGLEIFFGGSRKAPPTHASGLAGMRRPRRRLPKRVGP